jgi:hypothetical protein
MTNWKRTFSRGTTRGIGARMAWIAGCCLALITPRAIEVEWDPSTSPGVIGYRIYCAKDELTPECLTAGSASIFRLDDLEPGATYTLYATAYDAAGRESPRSNTLTYTVPLPPESDPYGVPITSFTRMTSGSVRLNWDSLPGTAYRILFKDSLTESAWRVMEAELLAGSESMYFVDLSAAEAPNRFYRLQFISDTPAD